MSTTHTQALTPEVAAGVAYALRGVMTSGGTGSRANPSDNRSPRFEVTSACNSSSTMRFSDENRNGASSEASSNASCSGVVSMMSGG